MKEYQSFFKTVDGNEGEKCHYSTRLDTYGCGCFHDCKYCYAKSLLEFRGFWNPKEPRVANIKKIENKIKTLPKNMVVRMGGMTDCFQPCESKYKITYQTIQLLNKYSIHYLIVTKSNLIATDEYMRILDKNLAHIQITVTSTDDNLARTYEDAAIPSLRIAAIEKLHANGFDVTLRLSPFIPEYIDFNILQSVKCNKILVEFLRVNSSIKKIFPIDYTPYTHYEGGYRHLPLDVKKQWIEKITGFEQLSVCEDCSDAYLYWKTRKNNNPCDCCNLTMPDELKSYIGDLKLWKTEKIAFLNSQICADATMERVKTWADNAIKDGYTIVSGFQSKAERAVLKEILKNNGKAVMVLPRKIFAATPKQYEAAINERRLLIISPFDLEISAITRNAAKDRNQFILDSCDKIVVGDITSGGMLDSLLQKRAYIMLGSKLK